MKRFVPIFLAALLAGFASVTEDPPGLGFSSSLGDSFARAARTNQPMMVYIGAPWCGACLRMESTTFENTAVQSRLAGFVLAYIEMHETDRKHRIGPYHMTEAKWAERLGAETTPTLVFLDSDGAVMGRQVGYLPAEGLLPVLDAS